MKQEDLKHLQIYNLLTRTEKQVKIDDEVYLVAPGFIGRRKRVLYESLFKRARMENGKAIHLDFNESYFLRGKLLEVSVRYALEYGPLGDRIRADATYDRKEIGNFRGMISYMGGGTRGEWPAIREKDWQLVVNLNVHSGTTGFHRFFIDYYESVLPLSNEYTIEGTESNEKRAVTEIIDNRTSLEELEYLKEECWEIPVGKSETGEPAGTLACCRYSGYQRYYVSKRAYSSDEGDEFMTPMISVGAKGDCLYSLEYRCSSTIERYTPWEAKVVFK